MENLALDNNILGTEKISRLFVKFSIPAIIAMVVSGIQTIVDGIFVGNFIGPNAMASVSVAAPYFQLTIGLSMLISVGALSYMGRSLGEGNVKLSKDIFKTSTINLAIAAIIITFIGVLLSDKIAIALGANTRLLVGTSMYIKMISICILPMSCAFLFGFVDRLLERPDLYFKGSVLSLIVNIILNYILIKVLGFGIAGAALATGLSYSSMLFVVIWPLLKKDSIINLTSGKYNISTIIPVLYNGSSEAIASIAASISAFIFNMAFIKIAGESGVAAFSGINYIAQFASFLIYGISDGTASIISYNYGAKQFDRVKEIVKLSVIIAIGIGILAFLVLFIFGGNLVTIFVNDPDVIEIARIGAKLFAFAFLMNGLNTIFSAYFTAIGYAKESIMIALSRGLIFITIGILILPNAFGINGIWLTIPFAEAITLSLSYYLMHKDNITSRPISKNISP